MTSVFRLDDHFRAATRNRPCNSCIHRPRVVDGNTFSSLRSNVPRGFPWAGRWAADRQHGAVRSVTVERLAKGTNLVSLVKAIRSGRRAGAVVPLSEDDDRLVSERMILTAWYPFPIYERLLLAVQGLRGGGDAAAREMGLASAAEMLSGVHKMFARTGSLKRTLKPLESVWPRYFNFGRIEADCKAEHDAIVRIHGYPHMGRCHGHLVAGWVEGAVRLSLDKHQRIGSIALTGRPWKGDDTFEMQIHLDATLAEPARPPQ